MNRHSGSVTAYMHCSHCKRSNIKYKIDQYLAKNTTAEMRTEVDYWEVNGGK